MGLHDNGQWMPQVSLHSGRVVGREGLEWVGLGRRSWGWIRSWMQAVLVAVVAAKS